MGSIVLERRDFIKFGFAGGVLASTSAFTSQMGAAQGTTLRERRRVSEDRSEIVADVVIIGGGLGGCAAALAALRNGLSVVLTEETDWIGGQLTSQAVPPDENPWIETHGSTQLYRDLRTGIRNYYVRNYPLTDEAKKLPNLNPGNGAVSRLCHEPRIALAVLGEMFMPYLSSGRLTLLLETRAMQAEVSGDRVNAIHVANEKSGRQFVLTAPYFVDATELGDLLPMTSTEFRAGAESKDETGELHAAQIADPKNQQPFTVVFAAGYEPGVDNTIDKPDEYDFWRNFVPEMTPPWPGKLLDLTYNVPSTLKPLTLGFHPEGVATGSVLNLWNYRRIIDRNNFLPGTYAGDISIINWPQNDYLLGNLDTSREEFDYHFARGKQLSLSLFYWLQTEVPRPDGGQGWPGLKLRGDLTGTDNGMAKYPYVRESRRIEALFTVLEQHVGKENRALVTGQAENRAAEFYDSVGIGYYHIDLHPSTGGDNYIDFPSLPFEIPLGSLLPKRMVNLLPANKNIGTTHITNGCYRLHPVEWGIGEAVGMLVFYAREKKVTPHAVRENQTLLTDFQKLLESQGMPIRWPGAYYTITH
jgi:hypothetical protein